jgi:hypothetical protein
MRFFMKKFVFLCVVIFLVFPHFNLFTFMQIIANLENNKHLELVQMLFEQLNISFFVAEDEQSEEDDLEDAYWLKIIEERKNEPTTSWEDVKRNLNL